MAKSNRPSSSPKSTSNKTTKTGYSKTPYKVRSVHTGRFLTVSVATSMGRDSKVSDAQRIINRTVSQVRSIIASMDEDQKEIDALRAETRANLDKTQSVLDTF